VREGGGRDEAGGERNVLLWVAPGAVRYTPEHIDLLLPWLLEMREGVGPAEPQSGYAGGSRSGAKDHAHYEAWCQVAAEIDLRLSMTGTDREYVEKYYCGNWTDEAIGRWYNKNILEVRRFIRSAVSYISSGPCPRWLNCVDCSKYQSCRRKKWVGVTYPEWTRYKNREDGRKLKYTKML